MRSKKTSSPKLSKLELQINGQPVEVPYVRNLIEYVLDGPRTRLEEQDDR